MVLLDLQRCLPLNVAGMRVRGESHEMRSHREGYRRKRERSVMTPSGEMVEKEGSPGTEGHEEELDHSDEVFLLTAVERRRCCSLSDTRERIGRREPGGSGTFGRLSSYHKYTALQKQLCCLCPYPTGVSLLNRRPAGHIRSENMRKHRGLKVRREESRVQTNRSNIGGM